MLFAVKESLKFAKTKSAERKRAPKVEDMSMDMQ